MFKFIIDSKIVECNPFTLEDYTNFLVAKTAGDSEPIKRWMLDVLDKYTNLKSKQRHIVQNVIINLMYASLNDGDAYQEYVCECGNEFDVKIDPTKISIDYKNTDISKLYDLGAFKISLKWPDIFSDDDLAKMLVDSIESIYVGDDVIPLDDLSEYELNDLFNAITAEDMDKIKDILLAPEPVLHAPIVCPKCGKSHVHSIKGFNEFIRIIQ